MSPPLALTCTPFSEPPGQEPIIAGADDRRAGAGGVVGVREFAVFRRCQTLKIKASKKAVSWLGPRARALPADISRNRSPRVAARRLLRWRARFQIHAQVADDIDRAAACSVSFEMCREGTRVRQDNLREFTENGTSLAPSARGDAETGTENIECCSSEDSSGGSLGREYNNRERGVATECICC